MAESQRYAWRSVLGDFTRLTFIPRLMEQHWQSRPDAAPSSQDYLEATFLVQRKRAAGDGARIQRLSWDQVGPQEPRLIYALHHGRPTDPAVFATINDTLLVAPASLRQAFVHPRDMLPPPAVAKPEPAPASSLPPAKPAAAAAAAPPAAKTTGKRGRLTFAPKKPAVDLRARLDPEIFSAEEPKGGEDQVEAANNVASDDEPAAMSDGDRRPVSRDGEMDVARQSFVTFSSSEAEGEGAEGGADDSRDLSADMQIDSAGTPPAASNDHLPSGPTDEHGSHDVVRPRMKMVKVPRTFMENGYLSKRVVRTSHVHRLIRHHRHDVVTEMVTEWIPEGGADENQRSSSPSQETVTTTGSSTATTAKSPPSPSSTASRPASRRQGSLLSFFKSRQQ